MPHAISALLLIVVLAVIVWIGVDAYRRSGRATTAAAWVIFCLLIWIVGIPWYLVRRRRDARSI